MAKTNKNTKKRSSGPKSIRHKTHNKRDQKKTHSSFKKISKNIKKERQVSRAANNAKKNRAGTHLNKVAYASENSKASKSSKAKTTALKTSQEAEERYTSNAIQYIDMLVNDATIADYLNKNVSRHAQEVLRLLDTPKTDEEIAASLDLKINAVRRILNIMQGYGITNYNILKNVEGWLSFAWYINGNKIDQFFDYVKNTDMAQGILKDDCNDYFICNSCYNETKFIFTFDAAFEAGFKCNSCGKPLNQVDKSKVTELLNAKPKSLTALQK